MIVTNIQLIWVLSVSGTKTVVSGNHCSKGSRGNKALFMCFVTQRGTEATNEVEAANGKKESSVTIMETNQRRITRSRIEDFGWKDLAVGEDMEREARFLILGNLSLDK